MLKHRKLVSVIATIAFCLTFLAPAFVAPATVEAASTAVALNVPTIVANSQSLQDLGIIQIEIDSGAAVKAGDVITISLPTDVKLTGGTVTPAATPSAQAGAPAATATATALAGAGAGATGVPAGDAPALNAALDAAFTATTPTSIYQIASPINGRTAVTESAMTASVNAQMNAVVDAVLAANATYNAYAPTVKDAIKAAVVGLPAVAADITAWTSVQNANVALNNQVEIVVPVNLPGTSVGNAFTAANIDASIPSTLTGMDITFNAPATAGKGVLFVYLKGATVGSVEGDVVARILAPSNSAFTSGTVTVGKSTTSSGSTYTSVASVKTIGNTGGQTDIITLIELAPNTLKAGEIIKVKLPAGFSWGPGGGTQGWGYLPGTPTVAVDSSDSRILNVAVNTTFPSAVGGLAGRVSFAAWISVDDSVAKTGDITARVYGKNGNVTEQDIVVAKYGTYGVTAKEGTKADLVAGKSDQKIGEFTIEEDIAGSLIPGRTIKLTLPNGVKWSGSYSPGATQTLPLTPAAESGSAVLGAYSITDNYTTLKTVVTTGTKSKFKFKDLRVDIAPDFSGPLTITVGGDASASGEVVVADVKPAVEVSAEDIKDVKIGEQDQALGTIVLKETMKENVALNSAAIDTFENTGTIPVASGNITLTLPEGAEWSAGYPTVEVTEGDLQLKTDQMSKVGRVITIPVKSESTTPSTIKISGLNATLYRTVPEGAFSVAVSGTAINETGGAAPAGLNYAFAQFEAIKAIVANCVTPAPADQGRSATFYIGSTIMSVNGVSAIMDVAPYIKAGRTYVPVRYLGDALGADTSWDEATKTVTVTKGDKTVVLVIGSTIAKVNGADVQMDVAPEITGVGRTMLPARWVAEGLGFQVGWNAALQQVVIQ